MRSHHQASLPALESIERDAIWHSDRGSVYTSADFQALVTSLGMRSSCENVRKSFGLGASVEGAGSHSGVKIDSIVVSKW